MGKGKMAWVPRIVLDEITGIKKENGIPKDADALKEMAKYSRVGREVERMSRFYIPKVKKKKIKVGGLF